MKRRRLIALVSVCTLLGLGLLAAVGVLIVLKTDVARDFVQSRIAAGINGSVYIGRISGNPLVGVTVDTIAIRDKSGEMFFSSGRLAADYDLRDLFDSRIALHHVIADHPYLHFRQYANGDWNYHRVFKNSGKPAPKKRIAERTWGDYVVLDSVRGIDASFILSLSWSPDDTLHGRVRDSVVKRELARSDHSIAKTDDGFARTYAWIHANALLPHIRIADPDSDRFGKSITIAKLDVDEADPPFRFRNIRGSVRPVGDSVFVNFTHWDLPASTGSATGKIFWGGPLPIRYDLVVPGDSVALNDVNWVYPTLPKTGGGKLVLLINNKRDVHVMDYALTHLDMRSTGSHLSGQMTFGVGAPVLQLRNVDLAANPVDFNLIKALSGPNFPVDWQGQIYGSVRASGGPLTDFEIDTVHAEFHDAHVPGALSRFAGSGGMDILNPAFAAFHGFRLNVGTLDLRTIEYLFPAFPKLGGTIEGLATLDSVWTDVRFADADLTHRDGPGPPSRVTGSGRITDGAKFITYDVSLLADSLSFETLAQSPEFAGLPLRGMAGGPITIRGQMPDLQVSATLGGRGGEASYEGRLDLDSAGGYAAHGGGRIRRLNLARVLTRPTAPVSSLNGVYDLSVGGSSLSSLTGNATINLGLSRLDSIRFDTSSAKVQFLGGRAILSDTLKVRGSLGELLASGSLGLPGGEVLDTIKVSVKGIYVDSLRPYLTSKGSGATDSLAGSFHIDSGRVTGNLDSLVFRGRLAGDNLYIKGIEVPSVSGSFAVFDMLRAPHGTMADTLTAAPLEADTARIRVAGLAFDTVTTLLTMGDSTHGTFALRGWSDRPDTASADTTLALHADGVWSALAGTRAMRLDSLLFRMAASTWTLDQPATLTMDSTMFKVDSFALSNHHGGSIAVSGVVPESALVDLRVSAVGVPIGDINRVAALTTAPIGGLTNVSGHFTGSLANLTIDGTARLDSLQIADVRIGQLMSTVHLQDQQATVGLNIIRDTKQVLEASADSLPIAATLFSYDTLPGRVHALLNADSADFALIQTLVTGVSNVKGKLSGQLALNGTWSDPIVTGRFALRDGSLSIDTLGITLDTLSGTATYAHDTLSITGIRAVSGDIKGNSANLTGKIAFQKWNPSWFDLSLGMRNFEAYNHSDLARVFASTDSGDVELRGSMASDTVIGYIAVPRGNIFLPDPKIAAKGLRDQFDVPGETATAEGQSKATLFERMTKNLSTDLRVHLGNEVALTADIAEIPLTGDLRITTAPVFSQAANRGAGDYISRLAPEGTINADRGTYTLDFGFLQRVMQVERGGTITFDRNADWNPILNLSARYNVRSYKNPDIPVIVDVTGRLLPSPKLSFRTDANAPFAISESDLVSYLITGQPDFAGQTQEYKSLIAAQLAPFVSSIVTNSLRGRLGTGIDLRVEGGASGDATVASNTGQGTLSSVSSFLYSTRISSDVQFTDKLFFNLSAGLCQLSPDYNKQIEQASLLNRLSDQLGGNLQYRLDSKVRTGSSLQFAVEPSTQAQLCSAANDNNLRGVAPTPRQFSLSLLKYWRW